MSRLLALPAAILFAALALHPASAETLSLEGASTRICQLTGDTDWVTNGPTAARTQTNFGLGAVDLGFPVDSGSGPLYFLFGDAWPTLVPHGSIVPDDALGFSTQTTPPDTNGCAGLQLVTSAPQTFAHPVVTPAIPQGTFNVPSGGVYLDNTLYAFFWTDHCATPNAVTPNVVAPLLLPQPTMKCPEKPIANSLGRSWLALASPSEPANFHWSPPFIPTFYQGPLVRMPSGFVYVSASEKEAEIETGPNTHIVGTPVFGVPRYRASIPYLAIAPHASFGNPETWRFYAGREPSGNPIWDTRTQWESGSNIPGQWAPPPGAQLFSPAPATEYCVGEHSATWNTPLHKWLLLYNCGNWNIEARFAPEPWGPWSAPISILNLTTPHLLCTIIMSINNCPGQYNYWPPPVNGKVMPGILYAPFVMNRYTQDETVAGSPDRRATIYWLVSTWNPYAVIVMQSTLKLTP